MDKTEIMEAARLLAGARKTGHIEKLPVSPADFPEAMLVQEEILTLLGEKVGGYKVLGKTATDSVWGAVIASRLLQSPARIAAADVPLCGIEGEIAFRLERDVLGGETLFTAQTFDQIVTALPVIELVDSRFVSYEKALPTDRMADFSSNGALICGAPVSGWKSMDLTSLAVTLIIDGKTVVSRVGGHAAKDPRIPGIAFLNSRNRRPFLPKGTIITTGAVTGLVYAKPGAQVKVDFAGFGSAEVTLTA